MRKERRMTVAEVAEKMGVAPRTYQDFEAGKGETRSQQDQVVRLGRAQRRHRQYPGRDVR
ncbi:helix-turn-helix domain-containing protein [Caulobacter segnis]